MRIVADHCEPLASRLAAGPPAVRCPISFIEQFGAGQVSRLKAGEPRPPRSLLGKLSADNATPSDDRVREGRNRLAPPLRNPRNRQA